MPYVTYVENSMFMPDLKECEVRDVILQLKNTSAGLDNLPTSIGKKCVDGYLAPLTYILNICIRQGVFFRELKLARVIPIYFSRSKLMRFQMPQEWVPNLLFNIDRTSC